MKAVKILGLGSYGLLASVGICLSLGWGWLSVTGWGKSVAAGGLALSLLPAALYLRQTQPRRRRWWSWSSGLLGGGVVAVGLGVWLTIPSGYPPAGAPVQQRFTSHLPFPRYTLSNIVPEMEQVNLGFWVMPYMDDLFTRERAERVSQFTLPIYREMEADPDFRALGSAMGWAYADVLGQPYNLGHYYLYIPRRAAAGARPAIVFLHGSAGNFKAYTWVWSHLADELGYVIIAPSFGFGNWQAAGGQAAAEAALAEAREVVELDEQRIYLAGLSNGGLGVSLLAEADPERFRGLILISPVLVTKLVDSPAFQAHWVNRPVLVVTGEADERVPVAYVNRRVESLLQGGVSVKYITYPGEDHFLFFSQAETVLADIANWLSGPG